MYCFVSLSLAIVLLPKTIFAATTFEIDGTLEREAFEYVQTLDSIVQASDEIDDLIVFDKQQRNALPPVTADLTSVTFEPMTDAWRATFTIAEPLPEDPGLAVNFDVFIDADGNELNNATTGVYRVGSDTIFMILHGTRTKWHSKWWKYDPATGRWTEQDDKPIFTISPNTFTLDIPYSAVPRREGIMMRGFSLTSTLGITAIDVAPGKSLPTVRNSVNSVPDIVPSPPSPPPSLPPVQKKKTSALPIFASLIALAAGSFFMWWKTK